MHVRLVIVIILLAVVWQSASAATNTMHENMLFLHSFFTGKHWQRSSDTLTYDLTPAYTALTPIRASMAGFDTTNVVCFSTPSNTFHLMHVTLKSPPSITAFPVLSTDNPVAAPLNNADSAFCIFAATTANSGIVFLASAGVSNKIVVQEMVASTYTVFRVDTLTVKLPSVNCRITKLQGGPGLARSGQSCLWATGTHGLVRYFAWNGSAWSSDTLFDIDTTETITAFSRSAIGTATGKIYNEQAGVFTFSSQPSSTAINGIIVKGAVCANGKVLLRKNGHWKQFTVGTGNRYYGNIIPRTNGTGIEMLDNNWHYSVATLEDSLTSFTAIPAPVASHINKTPYIHQFMTTETITIRLIDSDGNYTLPRCFFNTTTNLTIAGGDTLLSMHPDTACIPGFLELADSTMTLSLTPDSVKLTVPARRAARDPISYKYYWSYPSFYRAVKWARYNRLSIAVNNTTLTIINDINATQTLQQKSGLEMAYISIQKHTGGLWFTFAPNTIRSLRIFTLSGKQISNTRVSPDMQNIAVPFNLSAGTFCVEYILHDGSVRRQLAPFCH